jgi:hypothetical protein
MGIEQDRRVSADKHRLQRTGGLRPTEEMLRDN